MSVGRLVSLVLALAAFFAVVPRARADEPKVAQAAAQTPKGLAVVAGDGATDAAWPLALAIYGNPDLHPVSIDDPRARVLAGEAPSSEAKDLAELAELRAGVKGDDAASKSVLDTIGAKLGVRAIVVVFAAPASARVYDLGSHAFDAARYVPDSATDAHPTWNGALRSLERPYLPASATTAATPGPVVAPSHDAGEKSKKSESKAFWESPWFWVAVGAAALIGGGILIATNVQTGDTIHLQMRLP